MKGIRMALSLRFLKNEPAFKKTGDVVYKANFWLAKNLIT
jgi:hypothetical protein